MGNNSFGKLFTVTTWGESHGKAIGLVIDGCPSNLPLCESDIDQELQKRAPGRAFTSKRKEADLCEILSGVYQGKTTGAPISIIIRNRDVDSSPYKKIENILRPGHASYTYLKKYKNVDLRGGGRASARETACRVAAGAVAKKWLARQGISVHAFLHSVEKIQLPKEEEATFEKTAQSTIFCPEKKTEEKILSLLQKVEKEGDSVGGVVSFFARGVPIGLGEPIYDKMEARLASAMMSIPASKGFEMGNGFEATTRLGSENNDTFSLKRKMISLNSNYAGGVLGGITTGEAIWGKVAFKPTSSIKKRQDSVDYKEKKAATFLIPPSGRHDPCVAIRAVPVVEALTALVLIDMLLLFRARYEH